jgi:hypothetical protein
MGHSEQWLVESTVPFSISGKGSDFGWQIVGSHNVKSIQMSWLGGRPLEAWGKFIF